jgi:hypothetical protein
MSRWWRAYDEAVDDPKLQRLGPILGWAWFNLMCIASKNDGALPAIGDIAFKLRTTDQKAAATIAALVAAGLFDKREDGRYAPHNWQGRQYKGDAADPTNADRQKRYRDRRRNGVTTVTETVTAKRPETDNRTDVDDDGDASARAGNLCTPEALLLTEKLLVIAGHDPAFWPPGWCGAPMRVQMWINQGWKPEIIAAAVTGAAGRKRGEPANSIQFFEKAIAEEHARQAAPLPKVEIREQQTITVNHGTAKARSGGSLLGSIQRELASVEAQIADLALPGDAVLSIPDRSIRRS